MSQAPQLISALLAGRAYPHAVGTIELIETHISWVLLTGRYAYKIKKPVDLGFVDFSTLTRRHDACLLEVTLNRRFTADLYLGVVPITGSVAEPRVGGTGIAIEYAVKMRQFPPSQTLDRLLATEAVAPQLLQDFAARLAGFHGRLPAATPDSPYGTAAKVARDAAENLQQLAETRFGQANAAALATLAHWSADRAGELRDFLQARRTGGFIRECHGDLHLANLVRMENQCHAFDCLEFNAGLRWIDTMDEVAFLVMDLLARQRTDLAFAFLNRYLELSGDYAGVAGLRFYMVYRAVVRSKVWAFTANPRAMHDTSHNGGQRASGYLRIADSIARGGRPRLLLTCGFSGSGKSWLAEQLAQRLPAITIRSDVERKRILHLAANAATGSPLNQGAYTEAISRQVYEVCGQLVRPALTDGWSVIIDAAALASWQRELIAETATRIGVPFCLLHCQADQAVLETRVVNRQSRGSDPSEADLSVLHAQLGRAHQAPDSPTGPVLTVRTDHAIDWLALIAAIDQHTS